jgi:2-keto-3-deoxy-L-rhamnonate aldolase RhmA
MSTKNSFSSKLKNTSPVIGTIITLDSPEISEILSLNGFDWLILDMEHGTLSASSVQHHLQATCITCSALVRIPENDAVWIKKALDTGCSGIIVPQVNSVEDAKKAVLAAKYPPLGSRSVGITRAHGYGVSFSEYVSTANDLVALIIQIENILAVEVLDEILAVKGIDGVFIGPYDLSGSMNMLGQVSAEPVQKAVQEVKKKCRDFSIPYGIFVADGEGALRERQDGCKFIAVGIDTMHLANASKNIIKIVKS